MGASLSDQVQQTPTEMVVAIESGQMATLSCFHSIKDYNRILWYKQQSINKKLEFLGYILGTTAYPEEGTTFEMGGSANQDKTATLTIQNISVESSAVYFCAASASLSDQVHQTPTEMVVAIESGQTATLSCSHSIVNYNQILWYKQQRIDKKLEFLGYIWGTTAKPEEGTTFEMGGSANQDKTATLTIQNISVESSAVYFCAASASLSDQVQQTPTEMVVAIESGQPATLSCSHSIENYNQILWYKQQRIDKKLEFLGYITGTTAYAEKGMAVEMGGSAYEDKTTTLTIQNIIHNAAYYGFTVQKPLV
ncbi:T cell receptor alpha variable 36/delta variable 7 [Merluccius polli]|nr:T cell receptor alpha variable 36/delta variable 7 [Merluccius polli]